MIRVSLVETYFAGRRDLFGTMRLSLLSGDLRANGHLTRVFSVASEAAGVPGRAAETLRGDRFLAASDLVVFYRSAPPELVQAVRRAHPRARLCLFESGTPFQNPSDLEVIVAGRFPVLDLADRLAGRKPRFRRKTALYVPRELPFLPDLERVEIADAPAPAATAGFPEVLGRLGCPYRGPIGRNPVFDGLDLEGGRVLLPHGCSMCLFRTGAAAAAAQDDWVGSIVRQIRWLRARGPLLDTFRLGDHAPLDFLGALLEELGQEGLPGLTLLLDARVDQLLARPERWEVLAARARRAGARLDFTCVGFENFSQAELDRFNKGTTVAQNVAAVRLLRRLRKRAPDVFSSAYAAAGFITFTPWTTPDDLRANLRMFRELDFAEFHAGLATAGRLRLYPEMPLYHLAAREGLLLERLPKNWSRATGHTLDHPWGFKSERTAAVSAVLDRLTARGTRGGRHEVDLLEMAMRLGA